MKIPKTTNDNPYIEYRYTKQGKIKLKASSNYWGSARGFVSSDGSIGNTCLPKDLEKSMKAFKATQVRDIEADIKKLQNKLTKLNNQLNLPLRGNEG